jgi:hypothetical protein
VAYVYSEGINNHHEDLDLPETFLQPVDHLDFCLDELAWPVKHDISLIVSFSVTRF